MRLQNVSEGLAVKQEYQEILHLHRKARLNFWGRNILFANEHEHEHEHEDDHEHEHEHE